MDAPIGSLPSRPVRRDEIETLEAYDAIDAVYPVYGQRGQARNEARGLVLASDGALYAIAYSGGEWIDVASEELERGTRDGVHVNDSDAVSLLQDEVADVIGVPPR